MAHCERPLGIKERQCRLLGTIAALAVAVSLAGCLPIHSPTTAASNHPTSQNDLRAEADSWGRRYAANPGEKTASLTYARLLSALDENEQASAVLQVAAVKAPKDQEILAAYGKSLVDTGEYNQALGVLARAHSPDRPDWHILSAEGIASDGLGLHDRAQAFYLEALKIVPDDPGVLSNLGLSYALSRKLPDAERVLSQAAQNPKADPRVRQNLALVLALQGRFDSAKQTLSHDLAPSDAAADVADIRAMVDQPNTWDAIRGKAQAQNRPSAGQPKTVGSTAVSQREDADMASTQAQNTQ